MAERKLQINLTTPTFANPYENRVGRNFFVILSSITVLAFILGFAVIALDGFSPLRIVIGLISVFALLISHLLLQKKKLWLAIWFSVGLLWTVYTIDLLGFSGFEGFSSMGLFLVFFIASLLLPVKQVIRLGILTLMVNVYFFVYSWLGLPAPHGIEKISEGQLSVYMAYIVVAGLMGVVIQRELNKALDQAEKNLQHFQSIVHESFDGILITDTHYKIEMVNQSACRLFERPEAEMVGRSLFEFVTEQFYDEVKELAREVFDKQEIKGIVFEFGQKDRSKRFLDVTVKVLNQFDMPRNYIQIIIRDISEQRRSQDQIQRLAFQDYLTKIDNRLSFNYRLNSMISKMNRDGGSFALVYFDLNDFKIVNDTFGHDIGDDVLKEFAYRLHQATRDSDFLARVGGDEFILILANIPLDENLRKAIVRIKQSLEEPYPLGDETIRLTTSIGVSYYPEDGRDAETLLRIADREMYTDKQAKKGETPG